MRQLTSKMIESLPPAQGKRYEVRDALLPGLHLRVSASGSKVFYLSKGVDHRMRRVKVGAYPGVSLKMAREKAPDILMSIELGEFDQDEPEIEEGHALTLKEVVPQFIELYPKLRTREWKGSERVLEKFSSLYDRPINETVETSPVAHLKMPTKEVARERVLNTDELRLCWHMAEAEGFPFAPCVQLLMLTGQRRGEVSGMLWSELDFDNAIWTIPAKRAKNGSTHIVPLSPLAMQIIRSVPRYLNSDFVFTTTGRTPISGFGRLKDRLDVAFGPDAEDWRIHDLPRTVATNMAMLRVEPQVIEAVLNHKSGIVSGVAAIYNRHACQDEKREALDGVPWVQEAITSWGPGWAVAYAAGGFAVGALVAQKSKRAVSETSVRHAAERYRQTYGDKALEVIGDHTLAAVCPDTRALSLPLASHRGIAARRLGFSLTSPLWASC